MVERCRNRAKRWLGVTTTFTCWTRRREPWGSIRARLDARRIVLRLVPFVQAGLHESHDGHRFLPPVVVRSRPVYTLLAGLALITFVSGCGEGTSPETRATETLTALHGTRPPGPREVAETAIAMGTFTGIDREIRVSLTAEAYLPIATPAPGNVATHMAGNENR